VRLATLRLPGRTAAARIDGETATELDYDDVGALLRTENWSAVAATTEGTVHPMDTAQLAPVIPRPGKVFCVGLNYRHHILEMGRELPEHPTLFAKYPEALIGAHDDIALPPESDAVDWEGELAVVVGQRVRRADVDTARAAIAGYTILNDVTTRDWQYRTLQWLQGKTFEATTPFGPALVTGDEFPTGAALSTQLDGETVQQADTDDLVFPPAQLVAYISTICTLAPGDVIATGTPGGVGHARTPPRYLQPGQTLTTSIDGLGQLSNTAVAEKT